MAAETSARTSCAWSSKLAVSERLVGDSGCDDHRLGVTGGDNHDGLAADGLHLVELRSADPRTALSGHLEIGGARGWRSSQ
jgi:hypothetical protein